MTINRINTQILSTSRSIFDKINLAPIAYTLGVTVIRPMELDLKCLKMTDWNKTNGIGPIDPSRRHLDG